jgi:hypothetical protein
MEMSENKIPNFIFDDLLFQRRLQRNLNTELERLNNLLVEQNRLLLERKALMSEIHEAGEQRWLGEQESANPNVRKEVDNAE